MTIHCTAGHNYYVVKQDGRIYRCWAYDRPGMELGSVTELWLKRPASTRCSERICISTCDPIDLTIENHDGSIDRGHMTVVPDDHPRHPQLTHAKFQVMMLHACNYACTYCIANSHLTKIADDKRLWLEPDVWVRWWQWVGTQFPQASVMLAGGEPTIFPRFEDIVIAISDLRGTTNHLCTNMSIPKAMAPFIDGRAKNWTVSATAHPCNPGFKLQEFITLARDMRDAMGENFTLKIVDAKENKPTLAEALDALHMADFDVSVLRDVRPERYEMPERKAKAL